MNEMMLKAVADQGAGAERGRSSLAGPQVSSGQDEQGSVSVSKAYKEHMHYLCSPDPGVTAQKLK